VSAPDVAVDARTLRVDIWSDVVCPWCYLGVHRFEQALAELGWSPSEDPNVVVRLHAFELDPRAPVEPQPLRPVLERKYGPGAFDAMTERLTRLGDAAGIDYRFDRTQRVNTRSAHRLLAWASSQDPTTTFPLARSLFEAYFTHARNVADVETLVELARRAGLDPEDARATVTGDAFLEEVLADEARAHEIGVSGVPAFVLHDELVIPGAQDVDTFVRILSKLRDASS
jgi:predicted DsbA family dithiol-disulfide isomerase